MKLLLTTRLVIALGVLLTLVSNLLLIHTSTSNRGIAQLQSHQHDILRTALIAVQQFSATTDFAEPNMIQAGLQSLARIPGIETIWIVDSNRQLISSSEGSSASLLLERLTPDLNIQSLNSLDPVILAHPKADAGIQWGATAVCHSGSNIRLGPIACDIAIVSSDLSEAYSSLRMELLIQLLLSLLSALCVTVFVYHLCGAGFLDPIAKLLAVLKQFKHGQQNVRADLKGVPELKRLSRHINKLFNKIEYSERRLIEKKQLYESLIDTMADGLITMLPDGTIVSMNRAAEQLLGFLPRELVGSKISLIFADESAQDPENFLNGFIPANRGGNTPTHWEVEMRSREDNLVPIRLSISKMALDDGALFIGVLSDMSDIKKMQSKLLALNEKLSRSNAKLEQTVITDSLTGLFNRRHFDDMLRKELARTTRQQTSLSLLVVDIDFFKQYNDRYGHARGDDCLRQVSQCMLNLFKRSGDLPARYGGEEFAIILPNCDALELQERAETLRAAIEGLALPHADSKGIEVVTVSIGAVTFKPENAEVVSPKPKELFSQADKALYSAKGRGRNTVVFAGLFQPMPLTSSPGGPMYGSFLTR